MPIPWHTPPSVAKLFFEDKFANRSIRTEISSRSRSPTKYGNSALSAYHRR